MVARSSLSTRTVEGQEIQSSDTGREFSTGLKWATVGVREVVEQDYRLEASVYSNDGRQARKDLEQCKWPISNLCGYNGFTTSYHRPRFKRIYVDKSDFPIYQSAQVNELYPKPSAYISDLTQTDLDALRVKKGQVLLTCSSTIGNCTYVRNALDNLIFSHDLIRIEPKEYNGFIYAFLKSRIGFSIINTNNYGAVVSHIEPQHLNHIPIPNPPSILKQTIHNSSNLIKIVLVSDEIAGFLYCFLSSPYGEALIKRQIYGAVVDIIEPIHVKSIVVPFLKDRKIQIEINNKVLEAKKQTRNAQKPIGSNKRH